MSQKQVDFHVVIRDRNHDKHRYGQTWLDLHAERIAQRKPSLSRGEVAVRVILTLEEEAFREFIPVVEAEIGTRMTAAPELEVLEAEEETA